MITFHWHTEPLLVLSMLLAGYVYSLLVGPFRKRIAPEQAFEPWRCASYLTGVALVYVAVGSPLDQIGEQYLFSAHMVQHELLIYIIPPLLFFGLPAWLVDWVLSWKPLRVVARVFVHPVTAGVLFTGIFTIWHIPTLYEAALHSKPIHVLEHYTMFFSSLLMWWPILSNSKLLPPISYGSRILYVFVLMIGQLPVFAALSFAGEVLYPTYEIAPRLAFFDIPPLEDQVLGGVIMKVVNMAATLIVVGWSWAVWVKRSEAAAKVETARRVAAAKAAAAV